MTPRLSLFTLRLFSITVGLLEGSLRFGRGLFRLRASLVADMRIDHAFGEVEYEKSARPKIYYVGTGSFPPRQLIFK